MILHLFLLAWGWFEHTLFVAWTNGAAGHGTAPVFEDNGPAALQFAEAIGGHITEAGSTLQVWPA